MMYTNPLVVALMVSAAAAAGSWELPMALMNAGGGDIAPKRHTGGASARRQAKKRRNIRARSKKK